MEIDDYLNKLDKNPFALFDFLCNDVSMKLKQSESTIQHSDLTENVFTILQELRALAFSQSLLCNIQRVEYRRQVEEALKKLDNYIQDLSESQNKGLNEFIVLYKKAVTIWNNKALNEEKAKDIDAEKKQAFEKLQGAKHEVQKLDDVVLANRIEIENMEKRQKEIQEAIKKLQAENEGLNKEKAELETANSKLLVNKRGIIESVKYDSTSLGKLVKHAVELDSERLSLHEDFESLKRPYKKMKTNPPF